MDCPLPLTEAANAVELPLRPSGDQLLAGGAMTRLRERLRMLARHHDLTTVIVHAFDHRTRMLPFIGADRMMAPAGARAIGAALVDCGFPKTRIVLQSWNRAFAPEQMRLDGRVPDLFLVSSMQLNGAACDALIRNACRIDPARRPLIIAGGPRVIYQPWTVFGTAPEDPWGADLAVTGEEYVFLSLLELLLTVRGAGESLRATLLRARRDSLLDAIPGLVYPHTDARGLALELVDTGIQRLLGDLDELPHPALGYGILEAPSRSATLAAGALTADRVKHHSRIASLVLTAGCKFRCSFCPIPAYNQHQHRSKSAERISDEIERLYAEYGLVAYFGADDNFFNDRERALDIARTLADKVAAGSRGHCRAIWATEATVHDSLRMREHLPELRKAGLVALWLGVEDITGTLVKKGQNQGKTAEAFRVLREQGIFPIPMLIHHDQQPLFSWGQDRGLLNQVHRLRQAGALNLQVMLLTPSPGSRDYDPTYRSGMAIASAGGAQVEPRHTDGNHLIASRHPHPWCKQLNLLLAYLYFFNPLRLLIALARPLSRVPWADAVTWPPPPVFDSLSPWQRLRLRLPQQLQAHLIDAGVQLFGMWGLLHSIRRTLGWTLRLLRGPIQRHQEPPGSPLPMRAPSGDPASHGLAPAAPQNPDPGRHRRP